MMQTCTVCSNQFPVSVAYHYCEKIGSTLCWSCVNSSNHKMFCHDLVPTSLVKKIAYRKKNEQARCVYSRDGAHNYQHVFDKGVTVLYCKHCADLVYFQMPTTSQF